MGITTLNKVEENNETIKEILDKLDLNTISEDLKNKELEADIARFVYLHNKCNELTEKEQEEYKTFNPEYQQKYDNLVNNLELSEDEKKQSSKTS